MAEDLAERVGELARSAQERARDDAAAAELRDVVARLQHPVRLAIAGKVKAGKSTLLNALVGEQLAPTDAGECTRIVTWYQHAHRPYALLHPRGGGAPEERPFHRGDGALEVDLGSHSAADVDHLEVGWPASRLEELVLIDTPGIASIHADVSARTHDALSAESGAAPVADAVLYLLRHTHATDIRFLEAFHDDEVAWGTPVNSVGVLSRADEIGSSRLDAMAVAQKVAQRYQADRRLHRLCPVVVPVDGLLGLGAVTLRESDFAALTAVARLPEQEAVPLLLTAERFAARASGALGLAPPARADLLDRFGLFGVRVAVELLRTGRARSSSELAEHLASLSGLDRVREVVLVQFESRARILKTRSAVTALQDLLRRGACTDSDALLTELESVTSAAHEFEEVRVLLELRTGELSLQPTQSAALDRLMGGSGHDPQARLGLPAGATADEVRNAAVAGLPGWQAVARHPLSTRATQLAAQAACRTLEGLLADAAVAHP